MIRSETHGEVVAITLARPEKRNALTPDMLASLAAAFDGVPVNARAILLNGDGPSFCAGFDLKLCAADPSGDTMRALLTELSACVVAMRSLQQPVVLAAHGAAVAGGCALLGGADIVVAERQTKLGYPVVRIGVSPAVSAPFLTSAIPDGPARARMVDPDLISAERALRIGLVHEVVDGRDATLDRAGEIARTLAAKPGSGVAATKALLNGLARPRTSLAGAALDTSLSLTGTDEERARLTALWA